MTARMRAQLGQILDPNDTKRQKNPSATFKDRMANPNPAHTTTQGVGKPPKPPPL